MSTYWIELYRSLTMWFCMVGRPPQSMDHCAQKNVAVAKTWQPRRYLGIGTTGWIQSGDASNNSKTKSIAAALAAATLESLFWETHIYFLYPLRGTVILVVLPYVSFSDTLWNSPGSRKSIICKCLIYKIYNFNIGHVSATRGPSYSQRRWKCEAVAIRWDLVNVQNTWVAFDGREFHLTEAASWRARSRWWWNNRAQGDIYDWSTGKRAA